MLFLLIVFLFFISDCFSSYLEIRTTYQAVDYGILTDQHRQCLAWKLWWRVQHSGYDPTSQDIDLLAIRKAEVWIRDQNDANRYSVPEELLNNFTTIRIDFKNVCRLLPRVLQIASPLTARKHRINLANICELYDFTNSTSSEIELKSIEDAENTGVSVDPLLFTDHFSINILLPSACNSSVSDENELKMQYYIEKYGDFSFDIKHLKMDIDKLHDLVNEVDQLDILMRNAKELNAQRPFSSSTIVPFLKKMQYDARQPPALHVNDTVTVKTGILIESMSNFELSTMDYDIDLWLRMAWIDPRLRHGLSRPILVSYLNFYLFIFPDGKIFMDIRVYIKPTAALIVLCKYPHDNPAVSLKISSMGLTEDVMKFEWFSEMSDAIRIEKNVQIPELTIRHLKSDICNGSRKSGVYSCLEAKFYMHREVGYHIANTYIPTAMCVVFSWISVWLPEEFVEGRIFVSLTVFLTLSAENNAAKEELPKVSYVKAIDIWFGFTSTFVFLTMLQALTVISLEHNSRRLKTKAEKNLEGYSKFQMTKSLLLSRYYHKLARQIDTFCKVMYPVIFLLFLMFYSFVITQGNEDKCIL